MIFEKQNAIFRDILNLKYPVNSSQEHLIKTMQWLCNAQDATPDDGVARMYKLGEDWGASYPETTGYIIPTFLQYGAHYNDSETIDRAYRMTKWLQKIQHNSGYIQGGTIADKKSPAIFNTGQVLFGFCAAFNYFNDLTIKDNLVLAADYLVNNQDEDGHWRKNLSEFCSSKSDSYNYNIRTSWALYLAFKITNEKKYEESAIHNMGAVYKDALTNGWFKNNCLTDESQPLLHTIAYTLQGLIELRVLISDDTNFQFVLSACENLSDSFLRNNSLSGRYNALWEPTTTWRCLTGEAQMAIVWYRLWKITNDLKWKQCADKLINNLKATHQLVGGNTGVVGGIKGSHPIYGYYGKYEYLNWAAKFFADALMLSMNIETASTSG